MDLQTEVSSTGQNIYRIDLDIDIKPLQHEMADVIRRVVFHDFHDQIALTHRPGVEDPYFDGMGSLYCEKLDDFIAEEKDFYLLNSDLEGTYFESVFEKVKNWSCLPLGRVRLMNLGPKRCLSFHQDSNVRLHIPIFTSEQSLMIFEDELPQRLPADGSLYVTNTMKKHSVLNGHDNDDRVHIVFATHCESESDGLQMMEFARSNPGERVN